MASRSSRFSGRYSDHDRRDIDELLEDESQPFDPTQRVAVSPGQADEPDVETSLMEQRGSRQSQAASYATGPGLMREATAALEEDAYAPSSPEADGSSSPSQTSVETASMRARHNLPGVSQRSAGPLIELQSETTELDEMLGAELGSYRLLSLLGEGGMGRVYLAEHIKLGRKVALKLLRPEYAVKRDAVQRFFNEAQAVNRIGHENIVDITDFVELDGGETFIIMELLHGEDLSDIQRQSDGPMPLHRAMQIALQVCDALEAAHRTGIVHRDLKPDNIFIVNTLTRRDFVKLLDFGVAKLLGEEGAKSSLQTAVGSVIGTPAYMSPEQATAIPVDHRSDIYSLGAILYELFTGHPVFRAKSFGEFVVKHMNDEPIRPRDLEGAPSIPLALEQVILRCLEKDPDRRYPSVTDLRDDLARATATVETVLEGRTQGQRSELRTAPRRGLPRGLLLIPIIIAVAGLAVAAFWLAAGLSWNDVTPAPPALSPPVDQTAPLASPLPAATDRRQEASPLVARPHPQPAQMVTAVTLTLLTDPAGARVYRSENPDRSLGQTPLDLELPLGETVELLFRRQGYQETQEEIHVRENTVISIPLTPVSVDEERDEGEPDATTNRTKRRSPRRSRERRQQPASKNKALRQITPNEIVNPFE